MLVGKSSVKPVFVSLVALGLGACTAGPGSAQRPLDPIIDPAHPPDNVAINLPVGDGSINALMYTATGAHPHPTLLLLHGFPGNEQNLDLAQAARRNGWNVLTFHYRGTWGSRGSFSFANAVEDARTTLAWLRRADNVRRFAIDPARIAVAGHSMGGYLGADVAARDPRVIGLFLIDAWDLSEAAEELRDPAAIPKAEEAMAVEMPPVNGSSAARLVRELQKDGADLSLRRRLADYGQRPLDMVNATRGNAGRNEAILTAIQATSNPRATGITWPSDHSFNDRRLALAERLVTWLNRLSPPARIRR
jgi:pimeloyl-ACP methyl ester carboxylesterase